MLIPVRLKLAAVEDLAEAYAWYEGQRVGLGEEFLAAIGRSLDSIGRHPLANGTAWKDYRRAQVRPFPYSVFYKVHPGEILVRGIFHNSRSPALWRRRLKHED